jgi:hypothetical protein
LNGQCCRRAAHNRERHPQDHPKGRPHRQAYVHVDRMGCGG